MLSKDSYFIRFVDYESITIKSLQTVTILFLSSTYEKKCIYESIFIFLIFPYLYFGLHNNFRILLPSSISLSDKKRIKDKPFLFSNLNMHTKTRSFPIYNSKVEFAIFLIVSSNGLFTLHITKLF